MNFLTFPILVTQRLVLRKMEFSDENEISDLRSNEEVNKYIDRPKKINLADARYFIQFINKGISNHEWLYWAITLKNNNQLIGTICLWHFSEEKQTAETGYELLPKFHGKGIMKEALTQVIEFGFTLLNLKSIEAYTHVENTGSIRLLENAGFKQKMNTDDKNVPKEIIYILDSL
jgi:ribosomal-protein-alanine N-acetyltransferase